MQQLTLGMTMEHHWHLNLLRKRPAVKLETLSSCPFSAPT
jgi:hypothetical protein